jgi:hypothetical protein
MKTLGVETELANRVQRRTFLKSAALGAAGFMLDGQNPAAHAGPAVDLWDPVKVQKGSDGRVLSFATDDSDYQYLYGKALDVLANNTQVLTPYPDPLLIEGSVYRGIWLECAPHEGLIYSSICTRVARSNHLAFFRLQREDGQIPCSAKASGLGLGQIQMVVPIAATAWELAQRTGDSELLDTAYQGCTQWDEWLRRYRDTRKTGLCEGFCTFDTGHDNSPRWAGLPNRCPDGDARRCPAIASLPRLCPDLSATVYGGRIALAAMARALGKESDRERWLEEAAKIRERILSLLYDPHDAAFYDLDPQGHFVRIRGDAMTRVVGEHVVDQDLFETIYRSQIHNGLAFWAPYPLPSIALDDPAFVRPIPRNSWGGAAQALTALRAPRWMEHYGKPADLAHLMQQWVTALLRAKDFRQQMDPLSGLFTEDDPPGYSPAALVFFDFTWRLFGVRDRGDRIEWNIRSFPDTEHASFRLPVGPASTAELKYESGRATALLDGRRLFGTKDVVRLVTDRRGRLREAVGVGAQAAAIEIGLPDQASLKFRIEPNATKDLWALPQKM